MIWGPFSLEKRGGLYLDMMEMNESNTRPPFNVFENEFCNIEMEKINSLSHQLLTK